MVAALFQSRPRERVHKQECLFHYMPKSSAVVNNYLNKLLFLAQEHGGGTVSKSSTGKGRNTSTMYR